MNQQIPNDEISLKELLEKVKEWYVYLLSQWKIIVLAGFIGAILGLTYSFTKKPIYTATLTFALEDEKSGGGLGGALGLASSFGFDLGGSGGSIFSGSNLAELFKSRIMVEQTLLTPVVVNDRTISLAEMYIQEQEWRKEWDDKPKFKNIQFLPNTNRKYFTRAHDSILGVIYNNLSKTSLSVAQRDKKISIISMDVSTTNELFSKYFCDALARQVGEFYVATKTKKARANMAILQKQTDSIRRELNSAITGVAVANDNTFMLNPALNVRRTPSVRRQVDVQANTAILTELVKQTELAKVTLRKETPLIQVIDRPILPLPVERLRKLKGILLGVILMGILSISFLSFKKISK
ncbi:Chain length determinant protein [Flavobacterium fluvii]|uniref:Chain length determinant protein n=1 Tax=Flavobacterium fluvii TaxID=468056 RepID=A0A1M5IM30_9FLAO|nr:Wzz/FepE/Etk N-terminal domain-containing protein [Flavobacterium fluvii]SHG29378.1 Chain length determinant protein [Flavobacterium fluvii]